MVIGVIGHVDHGKTALVRALTGMDTDRLSEEKERGISIALGFAHLMIGSDVEVDIIDMPGHERFVRTMIAGATGIDAVLLAVAANEGIKPQTLEHVNIAALLGLRRAIVAVTKTDLVDPTLAGRVATDARRLLQRRGLESLPPIMTSALQETGMQELRAALRSLSATRLRRAAEGTAFLPIDRAFSVVGHGPVVTGTLRGASLATGDTVDLVPSGSKVRIRSLQIHGTRVPSAAPGQRIAANLRDVEIAALKRGMALAACDSLTPSPWLTLAIGAVDGAPPLKNGMRLAALYGTEESPIRLRLLDRDVLQQNQIGFAQLHFATPAALPVGEHVILRLPSPSLTVAGGKVLEMSAHRRVRHCPLLLRRLEDLNSLPAAAIIAAEVQRRAPSGIALRSLAQLTSLREQRVAELVKALPVVTTRSGWVVRTADVDFLVSRVPSLLAASGTGLTHDELLSRLADTPPSVLDEALDRLLENKVVSRRGSQYLIPRPEQDRANARADSQLAHRLADTLRLAGLTPPLPRELVTDLRSKRALDRLLREGLIVRAVDRAKDKELFFHRDAIADAQAKLTPLLAKAPGMLVTEIGAALNISRKYSMPLLEHLDAIRFTQRVEDRRRLHGLRDRRKTN